MVIILESGTSLKFKHISDNTNKIVDALLDNQDFLRWIKYLKDKPLTSDKHVSSKDVLKKHLVLTVFDPEILKEAEIRVFLFPLRGVPHKDGILADDVYEMNITMPNESSFIYSTRQNRFGEIARQVNISLDQQRVAGIGEVVVKSDYHVYKINEKFVGMRLYIIVTNGVVKEIV